MHAWNRLLDLKQPASRCIDTAYAAAYSNGSDHIEFYTAAPKVDQS